MCCRFCVPLALICVMVLGGWMWMRTDAQTAPTETVAAESEFPENWYFSSRSAALKKLEGRVSPDLKVKNWIGDAQNLKSLKGKVVIVDFWATWCGPCVRSIPHNIELMNKYGNDGFVFIGVHDSKRGSDKMAAMAKDKGINYPLAVDDSQKSTKAYGVSFFPTYVAIDRKGIVRAAGFTPDRADAIVKKLMDEKP